MTSEEMLEKYPLPDGVTWRLDDDWYPHKVWCAREDDWFWGWVVVNYAMEREEQLNGDRFFIRLENRAALVMNGPGGEGFEETSSLHEAYSLISARLCMGVWDD